MPNFPDTVYVTKITHIVI
ncbi:hypothetical protein RIR_e3620_jg4538.t1 [Rhizophagus irregularis DAOM 181602=DAOM 197198]|nr:hypothetical protein RIR_e3620_jg4538.t1 [Rhizophagus irregularis DAOM 181602=DAOM 197198]